MILWWINASFLIILLLENGRSVRINDRFILQYQKDIFGKELSQFYPIMMVNGNYQLQLPTETISFVSRYVSEGRSGFVSLTCLHDCYEEYSVCVRDADWKLSIQSTQSGFMGIVMESHGLHSQKRDILFLKIL